MAKYYDIDPETCSLEELEKTIEDVNLKEQQFNTMQGAAKVFLNAAYGSLGATYYNLAGQNINGCTTTDMAASITAQCRDIIKYSARQVNEYFQNDWNNDIDAHKKIATKMKDTYPDFDVERFLYLAKNNKLSFDTLQVYGDSFIGDSVIQTSNGNFTVEELFNDAASDIQCNQSMPDKFRVPFNGKVLVADLHIDENVFMPVKYIMRHKNTKKLYKICTPDGKFVTCTEDHSIIAYNNIKGVYENVSPLVLQKSTFYDICVCGDDMYIHICPCIVNEVSETYEYVYDIAINTNDVNLHNVYANGILVHNTDSVDGNSIIRTKKHPEGIAISKLYDENIDNPGEITVAGHDSVHTDDCVANYCNDGVSFQQVKRVIRHKVSKRAWKLKTSDGKEVICTGDHSLVVFRNGEKLVVKPDEIIIGDEVMEILA